MSLEIERLPTHLHDVICEVMVKLLASTNRPRDLVSPVTDVGLLPQLFKREQSDPVVLELASPEFAARGDPELRLRTPEWW